MKNTFGTQKTATTVAPLTVNPTNTSATGLGSFSSLTNTAVSSTGFSFGSQPTAGNSFGTSALGSTTVASTGNLTSGFGLGISQTSAQTGFSLGAPATTVSTFSLGATATTSSTGFSPGGITTTSSTGFNLVAAKTTNSTGFNLVAAKTTNSTGFNVGTTTTSSTGFSTGAVPSTSSTGFSVGSTPATSSTGFSVGAIPTTSSTGFNLGVTTTTSSTGFTLGIPSTSTSIGFSLDKSNFSTSATTVSSAPLITPSITTTAAVATSNLTVTSSPTLKNTNTQVKFSQLEENINKWTIELEEQEKVFMNQVAHINEWDRLLLSNGDKIISLNNSVEKLKLEQQQLDHELDFIVAQQRELEECLLPLEKEFADITVSDPERDATYRLAENLNTQLRHMSEDLKEIIEDINEKNKNQDITDPIVQIGRILNAHMNSLQWVDQNTTLIKQQLDQVTKLTEIHRRENDSTQNL